MGYLISETTKEEREKIVADSLGNIDANCDGCMAGLADMYQDYIDGRSIWNSMPDISGMMIGPTEADAAFRNRGSNLSHSRQYIKIYSIIVEDMLL